MTIAVTHMGRDADLPAPTGRAALPIVSLLGMHLHAISEPQAVAHILAQVQLRRGGWVITPNLDHLRRFTCDEEFASFFSQADLVVCDGMPLVWAGKVQGTPFPERVAGSDLIWSLSEAAAKTGTPIYLLGGQPGVGAATGEKLQKKYPGLQVVGVECPEMGFEKDQAAVDGIVRRLQAARPGIVFVALGAPKQEQLIARIRHCLPEAWWIGVGASFDFVAGQVKRAPQWMRRRGMEWMHRLCQEPKRLARRYLVDDLPFVRMLFLHALWNRLTGRAAVEMGEYLEGPAEAEVHPVAEQDAARPAKQFMAACDWAICLLLMVVAHGPLLCYGVTQLWIREAYQFFPLAWAAAVMVGLIRLFGARFGKPNGVLAGMLLLCGAGALITATVFWSWSLGVMSLLINFAALAYWAGGLSLVRSLVPAALIFLTSVPPPLHLDDRALVALRGIAVTWSSRILDAVGVLHVVNGNLIEIPGHRLFVAEACSGINSTMSSLAFAVACAMFRRRGMIHTVLLAMLAVLFAVAGNIFRISLGTALLSWFNYDLINGWKHETVGLIIFALCAALILSADHLVEFVLGGMARVRLPAYFDWPRATWKLKSLIAGYMTISVAAAIFIAPHVIWIWPQSGPTNLTAAANFDLPGQLAGWTRVELPKDFNAETTGKTSKFWSFVKGDQRVIIALDYPFMAYHDLTDCYMSQGWSVQSRNILADNPGNIEAVKIVRPGANATLLFVLQDEKGRWLVSTEGQPFVEKLKGRLALSGRAESDPRPSYQMQALFPQEHDATPDEQAQEQAFFREVRKALSEQLMHQLPAVR